MVLNASALAAQATQARGVLGSTPSDCWPFHFPLRHKGCYSYWSDTDMCVQIQFQNTFTTEHLGNGTVSGWAV